MSQKKIKRIRREENSLIEKENFVEKIVEIREILKNNWIFLVLLILGIFGIYLNSLNGDFVSDDYASITQHPKIKSTSYMIKEGLSGGSVVVPLANNLLAIIFGTESPIPYHSLNLLLYILTIVSAFVFIFLLTKNRLITRITTVIFSALPIHVEAVSWISGRPYLFVAFFVLSSLNLTILFLNRKDNKYLLALIPFLIALFFTDRIRGFAYVILLALYMITYREKISFKIDFSKLFLGAGLLVIFFGIISWPMINNRILSVNSGVNISESNFYNPFFQYPTAIPKYLQLILFPTDLTLYHTMYVIPALLNWMILIVFLSSITWFWFKDKNIFFGLAFIFAASAPSMAPVKVSWLVAERYVFMGSLGAALVLAIYLEKLWRKQKTVSLLTLGAIVLIYSYRIFIRNIDWQTNHNLWVNTCQVSPNSHNAWNNIGDDYDKLAALETTDEGKLRQYLNSIKGFAESYAVKPNYADAYHNQANIFYRIGRLDLARNAYEAAVSYNPGLFETYMTLIQLDIAENNISELLRHAEIVQQIKPNDLDVVYISAIAYSKAGRIAEAKELSEILYREFPNITEIKDLYTSLQSTNLGTGES